MELNHLDGRREREVEAVDPVGREVERALGKHGNIVLHMFPPHGPPDPENADGRLEALGLLEVGGPQS
eukprot:1160049-Alexandrium_andersonii.AAC.1